VLNQANETTPALVCEVGARLLALPLDHVIETMRPLPVEPFACAQDPDPSAVRGLAIIRGAPTPVVDAGRLVGDARATEPGRFVTVRAGATRRVALAVSGVLGVRHLPMTSIEELPPLLQDVAPDAVVRVGVLDARFLVVLEAARVISEATWELIERRAS
jgi:purine-binding chemotaxis protein CheW